MNKAFHRLLTAHPLRSFETWPAEPPAPFDSALLHCWGVPEVTVRGVPVAHADGGP